MIKNIENAIVILEPKHIQQVMDYQKDLYCSNFKDIKFVNNKFLQELSLLYEKENHYSSVLVIDGKIVGFYLYYLYAFYENYIDAELLQLYVAEQYRGNGFGKILIQNFEKSAQDKNKISRYSLEVTTRNENAVKLYEKMGYKNVEEYYESSETRCFMCKHIR